MAAFFCLQKNPLKVPLAFPSKPLLTQIKWHHQKKSGGVMKQLKKLSLCVCAAFLLVSGCSSVHQERVHPVADIFVQFDAGQSVFNNRYALTERLNSVLAGYEKRPVVVVVASGNKQEDFTLAVSRLYSIVNAVDVDADYRVLVKPLERFEQRDRVGIYHAENWGAFEKAYMHDGDYSWVDGSNGIYRSSDERLFMAVPTMRHLQPVGSNGLQQTASLLEALGWSLQLIGEEPEPSDVHLNDIQIVTLEKVASRIEVSLLLDDVIGELMPGCDYEVVAGERLVKVWKKDLIGKIL